MTLDFVVSLILHRFLLKFLLFFHKTGAGCCQLPLPLPGKRLAHLSPSSFSPYLLPTSDSVRNFPVTSLFCPQRGKVWVSISLFALAIVSVLLLATDSFTVSDFESFQSSSRSSMVFSPAVGGALVLPAVGYALVLPAVGFAILPGLCSSRRPRTRVAFFPLLTTGSLAVVLSLLPPASLSGCFPLRGSLLSPPTSLLNIQPLRHLVPRIGSSQQRVLLTMRIGFFFARYFSFTCSAEMSVSLFTGSVHPHEVRVFIAASDWGQQSHTRYRYLLRCVGWCTSIRTAVSCDRSSCAAVSLVRLCWRPHISEFCRDFV